MKIIPITEMQAPKYKLTKDDKEYLESFAVDGVIPFQDYIMALNKILNKQK